MDAAAEMTRDSWNFTCHAQYSFILISSKTICRKKCSSQQDALHFTKAIKKFDIAIQTSHGVPLFAQDEYKYWNLTLFQLLQDSNPIIVRKMYRKLQYGVEWCNSDSCQFFFPLQSRLLKLIHVLWLASQLLLDERPLRSVLITQECYLIDWFVDTLMERMRYVTSHI